MQEIISPSSVTNLEMNKSKQNQPVVTYKRMVLPVSFLRMLKEHFAFISMIFKSGRMNSQLLQTPFPSVFVDKEIWTAGKCICIGEHIFPNNAQCQSAFSDYRPPLLQWSTTPCAKSEVPTIVYLVKMLLLRGKVLRKTLEFYSSCQLTLETHRGSHLRSFI